MERAFINILTHDVGQTADFYETLLGMKRHFDSDWFVILTHPDIPGFEYGILQIDHDIVPHEVRKPAGGAIVTFVVSDCDEVHKKASELQAEIISPPTDMPYGQRRMLIRDSAGTIIDVSAPTAEMVQS